MLNWQHVSPNNDLQEHILVGFNCPCNPRIDFNNRIVIHNSWDCRESIEEAKEILIEEELERGFKRDPITFRNEDE
jgi:hypothetical protein